MKDHDKTKERLIAELEAMRQKVAGFEEAERSRNAVLEFTMAQHKQPLAGYHGIWTWHVSTGQVVFDQYIKSDDKESGKWEGDFSGTWEQIIHPDDLDRILAQLSTFLESPPPYDEFCFWTRDQRYIVAIWEHFFFTDEPGYGLRGYRRPPPDGQQFFLRGTYSDHTALAEKMRDDPRLPEVFRAGPRMALIYNYLKNTVPKERQDGLEIINDTIVSPLESTYSKLQNLTIRHAFSGVIPQFFVKAATQFSAAVFVKDALSRYLYVSAAMAELLGFPQSEIVGKTDVELFGQPDETGLEEVNLHPFPWYWPLVGKTVRRVIGKTTTELKLVMLVQEGFPWGGQTYYWGAAIRTDYISATRDSSGTEIEYRSKAMQDTMKDVLKVAKTDTTVLLTGETGTGKDFLARYIHDHSGRANKTYFSVDCPGIPESLAESELFGYEKGAFYGANETKPGRLEQADGGTILLSEIGDLPLPIQAKLLDFLDGKPFMRLGGKKPTTVNVRLIAATNKDLEQAMEKGQFRTDLFYRINRVSIKVPSLKERREDIPILIEELLLSLMEGMGMSYLPYLDPVNVAKMVDREWPGNVREMRNVLERSIIMGGGPKLTIGLPESHSKQAKQVRSESDWVWSVGFPPEKGLEELLKDMKSSLIDEALRRSGGKVSAAASLVGISRDALNGYLRLRKLSVARTHTLK